jgi:predicted nucleic acid-binding protein
LKLIVDSGPLVALLNRRDALHRWAKDVLAGHPAPVWSCEPVLAEVAYLSGRPRDVVAMVSEGAVRIGLAVQAQAASLERLLQKYAGQMDLADACVVRLSELYRDCLVATADRHDFRVYRRNGREIIPLVVPPE